MSKLSRKRVRNPGPVTSTQITNSTHFYNERPSPRDRDEEVFQRQLEAAIKESKEQAKEPNCYGKKRCFRTRQYFPKNLLKICPKTNSYCFFRNIGE